jgi:hypothetical protein
VARVDEKIETVAVRLGNHKRVKRVRKGNSPCEWRDPEGENPKGGTGMK